MLVLLTMLLLPSAPLQHEPDIARPELLSSEDESPPIDEAAVLAFVKKPFDPMTDRRP